MNSTYRKFSGWVGIVAIVFAQLALSAYACPMLLEEVGDRADTASVSAQPANYPEFASPNLCHKYCAEGQQNINDAPQLQAFAALGRGFSVTPVMTSTATMPTTRLTNPLLHGPAPPLTIQHCCFRI